MKIYQRDIILRGHHDGTLAQLTVIRLPRSWYAVVWHCDELYQSFDQPMTDKNRPAFELFDDDDYFLGHVRLVADFEIGVEYDYCDDYSTHTH